MISLNMLIAELFTYVSMLSINLYNRKKYNLDLGIGKIRKNCYN